MPLTHFATALMAVVDFIVFHAVAVGLTTAIYSGIPLLDDAIDRSSVEWNWLGIFKIVGPTVTVPGGAVTVLSAYFYARRLQEMEKEKEETEHQRQEEARLRQDAERERQEEAHLRQEAEAQVQTLKAQLEQATAPSRRRNRRRLRNGPYRSGR